MNTIYEKITSNPKSNMMVILFLIMAVIVCGITGYYFWSKHTTTQEKLQEAVVMTQKQAENENYLQNELKLSKQNAEMLAAAVIKSQLGQIQPVAHFTIEAPTIQQATEQVVERIKEKDPTLPPAALEKTDNTIVVPNDKKTPQANYDVAIFKNNNYRNWEWSVGYGVQDGSKYIPIGLQRNYSKDKAIEAEVHLDAGNIKKINGAEIKAVWKTDKLFILF